MAQLEKAPGFDQDWDEAHAIAQAAKMEKMRREETNEVTAGDLDHAAGLIGVDIKSSQYREQWNDMYRQPIEEIPWARLMPEKMKGLIRDLGLKPGASVLDAGCGRGENTKYLADQGYDVLGIDLSDEAIRQNKAEFQEENLEFKAMNALDLPSLGKKFDLALDMSLFHHISPAERKNYAQALAMVMDPGARFALCCFTTKEEYFKGEKTFVSPTGTVTYILDEEEIVDAFQEYFNIDVIDEVTFGKKTKYEEVDKKTRHLVTMTRNGKLDERDYDASLRKTVDAEAQ